MRLTVKELSRFNLRFVGRVADALSMYCKCSEYSGSRLLFGFLSGWLRRVVAGGWFVISFRNEARIEIDRLRGGTRRLRVPILFVGHRR